MRLLETLQRLAAEEQSPFRAQLLREDIARLKQLQELAHSAPDVALFKQRGMRIGWTQGDLRTHELRTPLESLLDAVYAYETGAGWRRSGNPDRRCVAGASPRADGTAGRLP